MFKWAYCELCKRRKRVVAEVERAGVSLECGHNVSASAVVEDQRKHHIKKDVELCAAPIATSL